MDDEVDDVESDDVHETEVFVSEYSVEDEGIEEDEVAPPLPFPNYCPVDQCLCLPYVLVTLSLLPKSWTIQ